MEVFEHGEIFFFQKKVVFFNEFTQSQLHLLEGDEFDEWPDHLLLLSLVLNDRFFEPCFLVPKLFSEEGVPSRNDDRAHEQVRAAPRDRDSGCEHAPVQNSVVTDFFELAFARQPGLLHEHIFPRDSVVREAEKSVIYGLEAVLISDIT